MADLIQLIQLDRGQFVATSDFMDGTLGGWYVPLTSLIELRYKPFVNRAGKQDRKLDTRCLPTSSIHARLCVAHRVHWTDTRGCPVCHPRPVSKPQPQPVEEPAFPLFDNA